MLFILTKYEYHEVVSENVFSCSACKLKDKRMNEVHPPINSGILDMESLDEVTIKKRWRYSFFAYYGFIIPWGFLLPLISLKSISLYELSKLSIPCLHYYFYRKRGIYWFLLFTRFCEPNLKND